MIDFFLNNLDCFSPLLPPIVLMLIVKRKGESFIIALFLVTELILNTLSSIWIDVLKYKNNLFFYQLNAFLSIIILTFFFQKISTFFQKLKYFKSVIWIASCIVGAYSFFESNDSLNSYSYGIISLIIIFHCLSYYYQIIADNLTKSIFKSEIFWIVSGIFIYYISSIIIYLSYKAITINHINPYLIWKFHNIIFSIMCILISIGFSCSPSQKTQSY